jgi:hypothetical protein
MRDINANQRSLMRSRHQGANPITMPSSELLTINDAPFGSDGTGSVAANRSDMPKSIAIILAAFALAGCATADHSSREILPRNSIAWDGLGRDPNRPARSRRTIATKKPTDAASSTPDDEAVLAAVPKYSKEWVALYEAMQARDEARLARALIICHGCFPLADGEPIGSIK